MTTRLDLNLQPSRRFLSAIVLSHGIAALVPWWLGLPAVAGAGISGLVISWGARQARRFAWLSHPDAVRELSLLHDGTAFMVRRSGTSARGRLLGVTAANGVMTVLAVRGEDGSKENIVIPGDGCGAVAYRRLQVYVRWARWQGNGESPLQP